MKQLPLAIIVTLLIVVWVLGVKIYKHESHDGVPVCTNCEAMHDEYMRRTAIMRENHLAALDATDWMMRVSAPCPNPQCEHCLIVNEPQ